MKRTGRLTSVGLIFLIKAYFYTTDYIHGVGVSPLEWAISILLLIGVYYLGLHYDRSRYYAGIVRDLFDHSQTMLWTYEWNGDRSFISEGCEAVYGFPREAFESDPNLWLKQVHPSDQAIADEFEIETLNGEQRTARYRIYHRNGSIKWIQNTGNPVYNRKGALEKIIGVTIDVTTEVETQKKLQSVQSAIDEAAIVTMTDASGTITYVNEKFVQISGYSSSEVIGKTHKLINSGFHSSSFFKEMWETIQSGNSWKGLIRNQGKEGCIFWMDATIVPILDSEGKPYEYVSIRYDITEQIESKHHIQYLAFHDQLTGLGNRHAMNTDLDNTMSDRPYHKPLSLLFLDLDRFKTINDTLGHRFGDRVLNSISFILKSFLGDEAKLYRYGGDEFIVLVENGDEEQAVSMAQDMIAACSEPIQIDGCEVYTTPSIGISLFPDHAETSEQLLRMADTAMYAAKEHGRCGYRLYDTFLDEKTSRTAYIERELRKALTEEDFELHYQPKVNLVTMEVVGYEALIRWRHETEGWISPGEFITIAEETDVIFGLGEWVLHQACRDMKQSQKQVAINISPRQFEDPMFLSKIKGIFRQYEIEPSFFEFEITESVMKDKERTQSIVQDLKNMGIHISIDDFGTGYSNLALLSDLNIDVLKIDRSFIQQSNEELVETVIRMGESMGCSIIAEGIETREQAMWLIKRGCSVGQGYWLGKPSPIAKNQTMNC
ncbi:EAL and GGDEF domain-containing protein [Pontibacillus yanchengensis]|uniref:Diguanylate cyclase n=1 Tax=Pontibacillus yanchengensis Y32 TaxID=1385514 RepID=A0A0A2TBC4_9BACI|nr:GGDEF and EAL domain-containing protein [Pontibacillus yanchengensis]KGP72824.1 diguanylate cyclase [Pontibacillus yanchengensis Y32]